MRIRRSLDLRRVRKTKRSTERRRAFFAACNAAYEAMPVDPELWTRERAELERTLMDGPVPRRPAKVSPEEVGRRRTFAVEYNAAYEAMQADPALWEAEMAERRLWEATLLDGLEEEY